MRLQKFTAAALISAAAVLFFSSGCAPARARDEHAAQVRALRTLHPIAAPKNSITPGEVPADNASSVSPGVKDSDLVKVLESLTPIDSTP